MWKGGGFEGAEELLAEIGELLFGFAGFAFLLGEVARAVEGELFEGSFPAGELAGAGFGELADLLEGAGEGLELGAGFDDGDHGADFAGGAASDRNEGEEFSLGGALEAFGDVVGDGGAARSSWLR